MVLEDELLKVRFLCGISSALARIYQKYADQLLVLAAGLLSDANAAEDVLHDVFPKFARSNGTFRLAGSLRSYLAIPSELACVSAILSSPGLIVGASSDRMAGWTLK